MPQSEIEVKDFTVTTSTIVKYVNIEVLTVKLRDSATIAYYLLDANKQLIKKDIITMSGTDYTNWGNDDGYLEDYVLNQLNISRNI